ncbi:MAG: SGNH/GDSL hydrolase family protein [Gordonia sp. (in: high G+C Gram-positive bacteria)]|uniref:SGNH/GDSL hydrolase family protein n=1 Tax=Gordonia sp. (in: high G+C Gram-positive bacteria) TaxID=84139 RepID=UPI003BB4CBB2
MTQRRPNAAATVGLVAAAIVALVFGLLSCARRDEPPAPHRHVHLGDSYASGMGLQPSVPDAPFLCMRAEGNYGQLVARRNGWELTDVSCAGAQTANLTVEQYFGVPPQLDVLDDDVATVTMTLGGNDADVFALATGECRRLGGADPDGAPCAAALRTQLFDAVDHRVRPNLVAGLRAVVAQAPRAQVVVTGYPWLLPATGGCFDEVSVATGDVPFLRALQRRLNDAVRMAATAAGVTYVDLEAVSAGRDVCAGEQQRWISPAGRGPGSLHPTARGQQGIADAVQAALDR